MARHSKNSTAATHFTYHEKTAAGHGTLKRRFGKDAQLPFGSCCLCVASMHDGKSPLVSPSGFVYCKECIYANLLSQKRAIQENVASYERALERQEQQAQDDLVAHERAQLQTFLESATGGATASSSAAVAAAQTDEEASAEAFNKKLREKVDRTTDDDKRAAMKRTSFWIPDCTPGVEAKAEKPDLKTRDPMSLDELKLKHLMPVKFEWSSASSASSSSKDPPHVLCAVTKKEITHHQAVLLRPSGLVILESCVKDMVLPTMTCPVTGLKLRKKDIVKLQAGGTGFSAHSTVEAKKYRPTMT